MIQVGDIAPDFTLRNHLGEETTLSDFRGTRNVVLHFYPAAFSSVCTRQFTDVSAGEGRDAEAGAQTIGVSVDNWHALGAFARALGLDATLLVADFEPKGAVARAYGLYNTERGTATRATVVIDREGIVRHVDMPPPLQVPDDAAVMDALATCNS